MLNLSRSQGKWKGGAKGIHGGFSSDKQEGVISLKARVKITFIAHVILWINLFIAKIMANTLMFQKIY